MHSACVDDIGRQLSRLQCFNSEKVGASLSDSPISLRADDQKRYTFCSGDTVQPAEQKKLLQLLEGSVSRFNEYADDDGLAFRRVEIRTTSPEELTLGAARKIVDDLQFTPRYAYEKLLQAMVDAYVENSLKKLGVIGESITASLKSLLERLSVTQFRQALPKAVGAFVEQHPQFRQFTAQWLAVNSSGMSGATAVGNRDGKTQQWLSFARLGDYIIPGQRHSLDTVHQFTLIEREQNHNYIQLLFPNRKPSSYNKSAPVLTDSMIKAIRSEPLLQQRLVNSLDQMLEFWGLCRVNDDVFVLVDQSNRQRWCRSRYNHNESRVTRVLHHLMEVGYVQFARNMEQVLNSCRKKRRISENTYWKEAVKKAPSSVELFFSYEGRAGSDKKTKKSLKE